MVKNNKRIINRIIVILTAMALIIGTWGIRYHKGDTPVNPMNNEAKASKVYENDGLQVDEFNDYSNLQNSDNEDNEENNDSNDNSKETNNETDGNGNEYVWVEVPKTTEVYKITGLNITDFDNNYENIEKDLHNYTETYRKNMGKKDSYYEDNDNKEDWFDSESQYEEYYHRMLKSVYQNGGFWVGRYEVGIDSDKEKIRYYGEDYYTKHEATQKPVIKANCYPYNWVRRSQAQVLARSMSTNDYSCSLMYGVQWDLMLKYIEEKSVKKETGNKDNVRSEIQLKLCSDSTTIGNYNNSQFIITNIKVKDASVYGLKLEKYPYEKNSSNTILLTTGASDNFSYCNIYDIAGNVWEWTLENFDGEKMHCTYNGGDYNVSGKKAPANCRNENNSNFSSNIGFRVFLY